MASDAPRVVGARLLLNPAGFGFAEREDKEGSIFIPPDRRGGGMDGDKVIVTWWPAARGPEGAVRSVVERHRRRVTGVLGRQGKRWWVEPDDPRVLGRAEVIGQPQVAAGVVVVAAIVDYPDPWNPDFTVKVEAALGAPGMLATEEARILVEHGIDPILPPAVVSAAEAMPDRVLASDREGRDDLRELEFMTIDPPDARDFDDAVCVEVLGKGGRAATMRVHVAVADVSHYVRDNDLFDEEALRRCFSTYLPDRVIPMLPFPLSAGICSLVAKKDRLAMVVTFDVDATGKVGDAHVRAAVIRSRQRLSYDQVALELGGAKKLPPEIRARVITLRQCADRLQAARRRRGALELSVPEIKVLLDEDDRERVRDIVPARKTPEMTRAYNLIEELMVAANEAVARLAVRYKLPAVYRVHAVPDEERIERFCAIADLLGLDVEPEKLQTPKGVVAMLKKADKHARRDALHGLLLRALAQAEYTTQNIGHFALASPAYLHFTSPIRRWPDLLNHRVLKAHLKRRGGSAGPAPVPRMPALKDAGAGAARSSEKERSVVAAERDAKSLLCAAFMRDRIGDRFEGVVSGLAPSGAFVMLDEPPVDGMIRRNSIEKVTRETYELDALGARMMGSKSKNSLTIGDRVVVEVVGVSLSRRQIELALMGRISE